MCFIGSVGKHTDLRPLCTVVVLAVGGSNAVSGFYGFIADRPHSIGYILKSLNLEVVGESSQSTFQRSEDEKKSLKT